MHPQPQTQSQPDLKLQAEQWAAETARAIAEAPRDYARHTQALYDLKKTVVDYCAAPYGYRGLSTDDLRWDLARHLPDFSTEALYQKRSSWLSLGGIILTGYLLGGALAAVLNWLSLGGEIIRVFTIWGMCWLSEYLASHPGARTRVLGLLGLGALGKFSLDLLGGMLSFTSWTSIRGAIFGGLSAFNPFKRLYLLLGAGVLFVLLSKKVVSLDTSAFRDDLQRQLEERILLLQSFFEPLATLDGRLARLEDRQSPRTDSGKCPRNDCPLALDVIDMLGTLAPDARTYLAGKLALMGYATAAAHGEDADTLVWNSAEHDRLYDMVGLVQDGDTCRILKPWCQADEKIIKGYVQRETGGGQ
ncbi:MAG: adenosine deaminase [Desulfovibrionaceae bacterium]|nr:adenosine deaminase [Desulfovibrionaceae bacterium]